MYHKYTGVILKKYPLGEADELLTIFTREKGKIRVKAVSVRKIQNRLAGHLQSLNEIEFETASAASREGLPILISVRATTLNNYLREDLRKFGYALVGIETLYRLTPDQQENPDAYQVLIQFLRNLGESSSENLDLRRFQLRLLEVMGFGFPESLKEILHGQADFSTEIDVAVDNFLYNVLEREIKSTKFLDSLA